jgi:hypothetical protein
MVAWPTTSNVWAMHDDGRLHWTRILGALVLVLVVAGAALILTGGQVSRILSTVGPRSAMVACP